MTTREQYTRELAEQVADYRVNKRVFLSQIVGNEMAFWRALRGVACEDDLYDVAVDWSIPVAMVKVMMKRA